VSGELQNVAALSTERKKPISCDQGAGCSSELVQTLCDWTFIFKQEIVVGLVMHETDQNSLYLWSKSVKERDCFGDPSVAERVKLKCI
jgi:hypothetical protein